MVGYNFSGPFGLPPYYRWEQALEVTMIQRLLKGLLFFVLGLSASTYAGFFLFRLWDWFVAPAFHLPRIST